MAKIIAVVIEKNESNCLDQCLDHLSEYVDKIIVIDNGSTDNSIEIAKSYDKVAEIIIDDADFHDGYLRNIGLLTAFKYNPDWIIRMDADEKFDDNIIEIIPQLISNKDNWIYAFYWIHLWDKNKYRVDGNYSHFFWKQVLFRVPSNKNIELPPSMYFAWRKHHSFIKYFSWDKLNHLSPTYNFVGNSILYHYIYQNKLRQDDDKNIKLLSLPVPSLDFISSDFNFVNEQYKKYILRI